MAHFFKKKKKKKLPKYLKIAEIFLDKLYVMKELLFLDISFHSWPNILQIQFTAANISVKATQYLFNNKFLLYNQFKSRCQLLKRHTKVSQLWLWLFPTKTSEFASLLLFISFLLNFFSSTYLIGEHKCFHSLSRLFWQWLVTF